MCGASLVTGLINADHFILILYQPKFMYRCGGCPRRLPEENRQPILPGGRSAKRRQFPSVIPVQGPAFTFCKPLNFRIKPQTQRAYTDLHRALNTVHLQAHYRPPCPPSWSSPSSSSSVPSSLLNTLSHISLRNVHPLFYRFSIDDCNIICVVNRVYIPYNVPVE
ncbi:hypothetical protein Y032_0156g3123 [Ancylostoma ceylanicum]|uniref:Uncharacterized protein n=1 Tax=Ancylostoma ceylanicum TaxID=53326 RepID=A0A016SZC5_9BILA|nr:hypothetical protein Y032_0156g3123 [Ancylostoma ceylanicum]